MEVFNALKSWIEKHKPEDELLSVVDGKAKLRRFITAEQAYSMSKYNSAKTQEELLKAFVDSTMDLIERKYSNNEYCCMVEIPDDIRGLSVHIVDYFRNKLHFKVVYEDENTIITNEGMESDLVSEIPENSAFLQIFWKDVKLTSMLNKKSFDEMVNSDIVDY